MSFNSWISLASTFKKDWNKIRIIIWYWFAINGQKRIRGGTYYASYQYAKANNKYMKDYDTNKELSYNKYWDVNKLYGWAMSQKFSVNKFEWI